jgi:acyl-CoA synthetase (AMP-forming)/AMP-acid ligase II
VIVSSDGSARHLSFAELHAVSQQVAGALLARIERTRRHTGPDAPRVVLAVDDPFQFVVGFFAVVLARAIPVPGAGPSGAQPARVRRLQGVLRASGPQAVLTSRTLRGAVAPVAARLGVPVTALEDLSDGTAPTSTAAGRPAPATAYVQYTSGSTSDPKPIALDNERVLAHLAQAADAYDETPESVSVNWVPLWHDMGLVTSVLRPLWSGYRSVILDPRDFARDPGHWLAQLTRWSATHTSSPNFGYDLCVRKIAGVDPYDLSALQVARNAGELVRAVTLDRFTEKFSACGFRRTAFAPSYGLAEATLTVTTCPPGEPPTVFSISRNQVRQGLAADPETRDDAVAMVSCGYPLDGTLIAIGAPGAQSGDEGRIGEVWISGPQVQPGAGPQVEGRTFLGTGDTGFVKDGQLVLIGRNTEKFQIRGQNYYSGEVEELVSAADPRLRSGRCAVFLTGESDGDTPVIITLAELRETARPSFAQLADIERSIVRAVSRDLGLSAGRVVLVPRGSLPVTTSGKLRREECRSMYEADALHRFEAAP